VAGLVEGMTELPGGEPHEIVLVPFTWRGTADLARVAPADRRVRRRRQRLPMRLLQAAWAALPFPPVEWLAGRVEVFHGTNFVAPPARRAACARATLTAYRRALGAAR
jgi:hypothetical protein